MEATPPRSEDNSKADAEVGVTGTERSSRRLDGFTPVGGSGVRTGWHSLIHDLLWAGSDDEWEEVP